MQTDGDKALVTSALAVAGGGGDAARDFLASFSSGYGHNLILPRDDVTRHSTFSQSCVDAGSALTQHQHNIPANTKRLPKVGSMLAHRLRCWATIEPTLGERLVFGWGFR